MDADVRQRTLGKSLLQFPPIRKTSFLAVLKDRGLPFLRYAIL